MSPENPLSSLSSMEWKFRQCFQTRLRDPSQSLTYVLNTILKTSIYDQSIKLKCYLFGAIVREFIECPEYIAPLQAYAIDIIAVHKYGLEVSCDSTIIPDFKMY